MAEAVYAAQRGAQIVRDGVAEGLEFLVGSLELCGALPDAAFQLLIELAGFFLCLMASFDLFSQSFICAR